MPYRTIQYKSMTSPVPLGAAETSTIDKWGGEGPDLPMRNRPRVLAAALAFVPVISAAPSTVYVPSQPAGPIAVQSFQYDDQAAPISVPAPPETITQDKWDRGQSVPL